MARGVHVVHLDGTSLTWSHDVAAASGNTHESTYVLPLLAAGVAALAALLPAMQAYRTDVADLLSQP